MKRRALLILAALGTVGFIALGIWQLERREWKLALIARVDQRIHAAPVAAPGPAAWPGLTRENAEYLRITATGRFLDGRETYVRALTELGSGYWVMAPFQTEDGFVVLVNRGFIPPEGRSTTVEPDSRASVTGLLRITEPNGGFLRTNVPGQDQWYSRDVSAIAQVRKLAVVAPYFIDAEVAGVGVGGSEEALNRRAAQSEPVSPVAPTDAAGSTATSNSPDPTAATRLSSSNAPIAGLTVVRFRNSHLSYALTWFGLALLSAFFGAKALGFGTARARP